ncbi:MAG: hypothetical protein ACTS4U_00020 [Candidatus Hodgkinia cicadicola]
MLTFSIERTFGNFGGRIWQKEKRELLKEFSSWFRKLFNERLLGQKRLLNWTKLV